ncbi:MAG: DMT family transporter [Pseudomonadota bacterium]
MPTFVLIAIAVAIGVATAVYLPMNAVMARHLGSPELANTLFFFVGTVGTLALLVFNLDKVSLARLGDAPWYLFLSGLVSALVILSVTLLVPRLGARVLFVSLIGGQVLMSLVVSHFGWLASPKDPLTGMKVLGGGLVVAGVIVTTLSAD